GDPDDIHEVPVEADRLDRHVVLLAELSLRGARRQDGEPHRPTEDGRAVGPGERVEDRSERAVADPEAELGVVVDLADQEGHAHDQGEQRPVAHRALVAPANGPHAELHREARRDEDDRDREGDRQDFELRGTGRRRPLADVHGAGVEVRREESAEEHHLAGDEEEHPDQRRRHAGLVMGDLGLGSDVRAHAGRHLDGHWSSTFATSTWSASFLWRKSKTGRSLRIGGSLSKLYAGGGEEVAHSRVLPSHGSSPTRSPLMKVATTFTRNGSTLAAMRNAPAVETR